MIAITGHFDGKVIVPDEPVDLPKDQKLLIHVEPVPAEQHGMTGKQMVEAGLMGLWAHRTDIGDSVEYARKLRRQAEQERSGRAGTAADLAASPLIGMWADREDITDSSEHSRQVRRQAESRRQ